MSRGGRGKGYGDAEIAKQIEGGTGKAIRTWAIAGYYGDVRDVSSIILIAEITVASMVAPLVAPSFKLLHQHSLTQLLMVSL